MQRLIITDRIRTAWMINKEYNITFSEIIPGKIKSLVNDFKSNKEFNYIFPSNFNDFRKRQLEFELGLRQIVVDNSIISLISGDTLIICEAGFGYNLAVVR